MKALLLTFLFLLSSHLKAEELKDPWTRDEDISNTIVNVEITHDADDMYVYNYSIKSAKTNRGEILSFRLNLVCGHDFSGVSEPVQEVKQGFIDIDKIPYAKNLFNKKRTPASISAAYGSAGSWSFSIDNYASWLVALNPGDNSTGLVLKSPLKPGLRNYYLRPDMEVIGWDYPEEEKPGMPWVDDFTVTGMIAGPSCPGVTPPVDAAYFTGSKLQTEPDSVNTLLTYSKPMLDRWHTDESVNELTITIHYADIIDAATFTVEPAWARTYFEPKPGTSQTVTLPLKEVRNRFKLKVDVDINKIPPDFENHFQDLDEFEVRRDLK